MYFNSDGFLRALNGVVPYYDREGHPISVEEWVNLFGDDEYKRVDCTLLPYGVWVSTVWSGLNSGLLRGGRPLIFETLDFPLEETMKRYSTIEEARAGHAELVALLRKRLVGKRRLPRRRKKRVKALLGTAQRHTDEVY